MVLRPHVVLVEKVQVISEILRVVIFIPIVRMLQNEKILFRVQVIGLVGKVDVSFSVSYSKDPDQLGILHSLEVSMILHLDLT